MSSKIFGNTKQLGPKHLKLLWNMNLVAQLSNFYFRKIFHVSVQKIRNTDKELSQPHSLKIQIKQPVITFVLSEHFHYQELFVRNMSIVYCAACAIDVYIILMQVFSFFLIKYSQGISVESGYQIPYIIIISLIVNKT